MTDLTKIDRPFGLLDEATQKALRECGGPWQIYTETGKWVAHSPRWTPGMTYRQKPQPPKPREFFVVQVYNMPHSVWNNVEQAKRAADRQDAEVIHVREVIE